MVPLINSTFYKEAETKEKLIKFIRAAKYLSIGEKCVQFEEAFAKYQGRKFCVLFNSGSSANLALIQSLINLGLLGPSERVGFSALTWATNVMPLIQLGLSPVPLDIEVETLNISSRTLAEALNSQGSLKALFITNLLGFCSDLQEIKSICNDRGIILLEDNCESLGSVHRGTKLGNFGLASTFSFYVGHHMSTIEGGAVCTDDENLAAMLKMVRAHGWDRNLDSSAQDKMREDNNINDSFYARYSFYTLGYNLRPTEITGFLGLSQLEYLDEILTKRNVNFLKFYHAGQGNFDFHHVAFDHVEFVSNFAFPVICKTESLFKSYLKRFIDAGIEVRPVVAGNITNQPFFKKFVAEKVNLPNADLVHKQGFYFGNNPEMTEEETDLICQNLRRKSSDLLTYELPLNFPQEQNINQP